MPIYIYIHIYPYIYSSMCGCVRPHIWYVEMYIHIYIPRMGNTYVQTHTPIPTNGKHTIYPYMYSSMCGNQYMYSSMWNIYSCQIYVFINVINICIHQCDALRQYMYSSMWETHDMSIYVFTLMNTYMYSDWWIHICIHNDEYIYRRTASPHMDICGSLIVCFPRAYA